MSRLNGPMECHSNELRDFILENRTEEPSVHKEGRFYYCKVDKVPKWYDGEEYVSPFQHSHPELERNLHKLVTDNSASTYAIDIELGTSFHITLVSDCQFVLPTGDADPDYLQEIFLYVQRDTIANRQVTWSNNIRWPMNVVPVLDETANTITSFRFTRLGNTSIWLGELVGMGYNV
jgi:hypothetical protein